MIVAGVDAGGGGVRVSAGDGDRRAAPADRRPIHRGSLVDLDALLAGVSRTLSEAAAALGVERFDAVCLGMTGIPDLIPDPARIGAAMLDRFADRVLVTTDAVTSHAGAFGLQAGTVVAAGTGVVALSTNHVDRWRRADGWGLLLGDDGGGAWIGRAGLNAALRSADGRVGGSSALLAAAIGSYGEPLSVARTVHASDVVAFELSRFAPAVADAARAGDEVAAGIWRAAGGHLASAAHAAADSTDRISWSGGLFDAGPLLLDPFAEALRALRPGVEVIAPQSAPAEGARLIAEAELQGSRGGQNPYLFAYGR